MTESGPKTTMTGLAGNNPLGFLAAMGVLEVAHRNNPAVGLSWEGTVVPRGVLHGVGVDDLIEWVVADAKDMLDSVILNWPTGRPLPDLKMPPGQLSEWAAVVSGEEPWVVDQWCGLVAENALGSNGLSKPTHLHFTAGQQRFLTMVRELGSTLDEAVVREAIVGPWVGIQDSPSLRWDAGGARIWAVRGTNPQKEKSTSVPGANWLGFRGLSAYPTRSVGGQLETTACNVDWDPSAFRWPIWSGRLSRNVAHSLVGRRELVGDRAGGHRLATNRASGERWARQGVRQVLEARMRRIDKRYGSFAAPTAVWDSWEGR